MKFGRRKRATEVAVVEATADTVPNAHGYCMVYDEMSCQIAHVGILDFDDYVEIAITSAKPVRITTVEAPAAVSAGRLIVGGGGTEGLPG